MCLGCINIDRQYTYSLNSLRLLLNRNYRRGNFVDVILKSYQTPGWRYSFWGQVSLVLYRMYAVDANCRHSSFAIPRLHSSWQYTTTHVLSSFVSSADFPVLLVLLPVVRKTRTTKEFRACRTFSSFSHLHNDQVTCTRFISNLLVNSNPLDYFFFIFYSVNFIHSKR